MTMRWLAWVPDHRVRSAEEWANRHNMDTTGLDMVLKDPAKYAGKAHLVEEGVGGFGGRAGKTLCGREVPVDDPSEVAIWEDAATNPKAAIRFIDQCKFCLKRMERAG